MRGIWTGRQSIPRLLLFYTPCCGMAYSEGKRTCFIFLLVFLELGIWDDVVKHISRVELADDVS